MGRAVLHLALLVAVTLRVVECAIDADEITDLPGLHVKPGFKQYSGYLPATGTKKLHYWFVESANDPANDPLVLWLNGGPGCSSLDGLLSENGPFKVAESGKMLMKNPFSWNTVANMLYLEAPAGVGYSYSDDKNYTTSDDQVSLDNYQALKYFLAKFSEFSRSEFYITGESYGGIYVPTLSARVVDDKTFNFKGFAVGNGLTDRTMNLASTIFFLYFHGIYGQDLWDQLMQTCCQSGDIKTCDFGKDDPACQNAVNSAMTAMSELNVYNLYQDCYQGPDMDNGTVTISTAALLMPQLYASQIKTLKTTAVHKLKVVPPCLNLRAVTEYLNQPEVRKALHIPASLPPWEVCSGPVGAGYHTQYNSMREQYLKVLATKKQRIMVYNGDVDMACNFLMDEWFVDSLKIKSVAARKSWHFTDQLGQKQVAGYASQFEDLTFVTVKGAGHMVPQDKPVPALEMFIKFLRNKPF